MATLTEVQREAVEPRLLRRLHAHRSGHHARPTGRHGQDPHPRRTDPDARPDGSGSHERHPRSLRRLRDPRRRRPRARPSSSGTSRGAPSAAPRSTPSGRPPRLLAEPLRRRAARRAAGPGALRHLHRPPAAPAVPRRTAVRRWLPALVAARRARGRRSRRRDHPAVAGRGLLADPDRQRPGARRRRRGARPRRARRGRATLVRSKSVGKAVLVTEAMPPAPEGKVYELWLQSPAGDMVPPA